MPSTSEGHGLISYDPPNLNTSEGPRITALEGPHMTRTVSSGCHISHHIVVRDVISNPWPKKVVKGMRRSGAGDYSSHTDRIAPAMPLSRSL